MCTIIIRSDYSGRREKRKNKKNWHKERNGEIKLIELNAVTTMPAPFVCNIFPGDQRFRRCQSHRNSDFLELWLKRRFVKLIEPSRDTCNLIHSKSSIYLQLHKVLYTLARHISIRSTQTPTHTHTPPACSLNKIRYCFFSPLVVLEAQAIVFCS